MDKACKELKLLNQTTKIITIEFDFSLQTEIDDYKSKIFDFICDYDISMVFINAGQSKCGDFLSHGIETHREIFDTNVTPTLILSYLFVERFLAKR